MEFLRAGWKIFLPLGLLCGVALFLLAKPSAPSPEDQIKESLNQITRAVVSGDAQTICQNLTEEGRRWTLDYSSGSNPLSCQQAVKAGLESLSLEERRNIGETRATRVVVIGDRARVWIEPLVVKEVPQPMPFALTAEGWKAG